MTTGDASERGESKDDQMTNLSKHTDILAADGFNDIIGGRAQQFSDNRKLVDICMAMKLRRIICPESREESYSRSFPGNNGLPSSISAKMQPVLQMSTATSYFCHVSMISGAR